MLTEMKLLPSRKIADRALAILEDHKAIDIRCIEVAHLTSLMDYMIVATGRSDRHVRSLGDALLEECRERRIQVLGTEGKASGEWMLVDLVDVVVHIMLPRIRDFYEIEKLWDIAPRREDANHSHHRVQ
jgi:ribosome-associated protein